MSRQRNNWWSHWRWAVLLIAAALILYLIGNNSVGLWDRDEPRNAQASRQMLQSGDWVVPRFLDEIRTAKPIFIYWCQAGAMMVFGQTSFAARFPSAIAMTLTIIVLVGTLSREIGPRRAIWTAFIFATSGLTIASAKMCLTDSILLLWIVIAQICLYRIIHKRDGWWTWIWMGIAIGVGGLTKGPIPLGVMGMTLLTLGVMRGWDRKRSTLQRNWGGGLSRHPDERSPVSHISLKVILAIAITLAICAPWLILVNQHAPNFLPTIIGHDVIARMKTGLEGHTAPPGFYFVLIWGTYFPWSLILPAAIAYGWRHRFDPSTRFAFASVIGPWVMFELIKTKLPHYVLPIFPGLALLTARMIVAASRGGRLRHPERGIRRETLDNAGIRWGAAPVWSLAVVGMTLTPLWFSYSHKPAEGMTEYAVSMARGSACLIAVIGLTIATTVFVDFRARRPSRAAFAIGSGMFVLVLLMYGGWLSNQVEIKTSQRVGTILQDNDAKTIGDVIMIDYKEPSLAFYQGGTIREESDNAFLAKTDPAKWPKWIVMTQAIWDATPASARAHLDQIATVNGWWYASKARMVNVIIAKKKADGNK